MKYSTINYDSNRPNQKAITVPLNSDYGVAVKLWKNEEPIEIGADEISVGGVAGVGTKEGYVMFELSSGNEFAVKDYLVEIDKEGEEKELSGFGIKKINVASTVSAPTSNEQDIEVYASDATYTVSVVLSGYDGQLHYVPEIADPTPSLAMTNGLYSYALSGGVWKSKQAYVEDQEKLTITPQSQFRIDSYRPGIRGEVSAWFSLIYDREDGITGKFNLTVTETDKNYMELQLKEPEPEPEPDPVEINAYYGDYSDSTVYSNAAMIEDNLTLPASAVMSFDCSVKAEIVTDFMRIVVCTEDGNWFTKPGDSTYGGLWYEAEGGTGRTAESITLTTQTKFALLHAIDEMETIWTLIYDRNKLQ